MRNVNLHSNFGIIMDPFNRGDMVRISLPDEDSDRVYIIKEIRKIRKGGNLYLLKSLSEDVLRLYYEDKESLLEKLS